MKVAFRVDASTQMGTGHVIRCLTLAEALERQGYECLFICRDHEGNLAEQITQKGFQLQLLTRSEQTEKTVKDQNAPAHADWLGVSWSIDAKQTLEGLHSLNVDWLVVDHYALDARWERQVADVVKHIMVIDDLADRKHECALLLDQNVLNDQVRRQYESKVNPECQLLLGPRFALLRPEYGLLASALPERDGVITRVLVFVGGSDPHHLTERYLKALSTPVFHHLYVDVVVGKNHPSPELVEQLVDQRAKTRLYSWLPSLVALMVRADLVMGAGGATNWERMCLGLNSIVVSVSDNQNLVNQELADKDFIYFLGKADSITVNNIRECLGALLDGAIYNKDQSNKMKAMVDGLGTDRLIELLK